MKKISLLLSVLIVGAFALIVKADLQTTTGTTIRQVFDYASGRGGKFRLDAVNNQFVFGSSAPVSGAILTSSGAFVAQSISATATYGILRILNNAASELVRVTQQGRMGIGTATPTTALDVVGTVNATAFTGDGSALTGIAGTNGTNTWTAPQYFSSSVNISSATSSLVVGSSTTLNGLTVVNGPATFNGSVLINGTINDSTRTIVLTDVFDIDTPPGPCFTAFSTITLTTDNVPLEISFMGSMQTVDEISNINVLMDGNYIDDFSATMFMASARNTTVSIVAYPVNFTYRTKEAVAAGSHSFCLTGRLQDSNEGLLCGTNPCWLQIKEAR
jgi:hypothetical protein